MCKIYLKSPLIWSGAFLILSLFGANSHANCLTHPNEGTLVTVTVEKIRPLECKCLDNNNIPSTFTISGCIVEGLAVPTGLIWFSQTLGFGPKFPELRMHSIHNEELCKLAPGEKFEGKIYFECFDTGMTNTEKMSCSSKDIEFNCAQSMRRETYFDKDAHKK